MTTSTCAELITQWRAMRAARLAKDKEAAQLKEEETILKTELIGIFRSGVQGDGQVVDGRVTGLSTKEQPIVGDRDKVVNYIWENKDLSILQFRLSTTAITELKDGGVDVPGIEYIDAYELYDRKV